MERPKGQPKSVLKCVVAIGGSAGSLEAFERFLKALPPDLNISFVFLQHMDPAQKSLLPELLSHMTSLPVAIAKNGTRLRPSRIYVIEPGMKLEVQGELLMSRPFETVAERRIPRFECRGHSEVI